MSYVAPQELLEALRDWGVDVRAYEPDGRPWYAHTTAGGWSPVGVAHHHTAGSSRLFTSSLSQRAMLRLLRNGRSDLPGPLCHGAPSIDPRTGKGVLWLVGWGNVNHAGLVDATNLAQIRNGRYAGRAPVADQADGNSALYALEYMHPGDSTPWPDELLRVGHLFGCAVADAHGWSARAVGGSQIEHRQLTRRKIDRSWHGNVQQAVQELYDAGPGAAAEGLETMSWGDKFKVLGTDGRKITARAFLQQTHNRAGGARTQATAARKQAHAAKAAALRVESQLEQLQAELPELVEHAAARGARRALEDSVVRAEVDVTVAGKVAS